MKNEKYVLADDLEDISIQLECVYNALNQVNEGLIMGNGTTNQLCSINEFALEYLRKRIDMLDEIISKIYENKPSAQSKRKD